jgi:hypothetical protein
MSSELEQLAARKQLLVAQASVQRLQAAMDVENLRESMRFQRAAMSLATSTPVRSLIAAGLLLLFQRRRVTRAARWASLGFGLLRLARNVFGRRKG